MTQPDTYLLAGGGTGGHLTPGIAVAAELSARDGDCRIVFVGSGRPIERQMVQEAGYEHIELPVESTQRIARNPLRFFWRNWQAYRRAKELIDGRQPRAVIGLGGYASVPLVLAASRRRVPIVLLEQNTIPGRANRFLSRRAGAVCLTFPGSQSHFPAGSRWVVTGNPVRPEIAELLSAPTIGGTLETATVLILGGSQGAAGLNAAVRRMLENGADRWCRVRFVHQAGNEDCEALRQTYERLKLDYVCEPFFRDMAGRYREATLVISRAGATTLAELACAEIPAVLVPFPHAADDHQSHNAEYFRQAGAAQIIPQGADADETARQLTTCLEELLASHEQQASMREAMQALARPEAAQQVAQVLQSLTAGPIN